MMDFNGAPPQGPPPFEDAVARTARVRRGLQMRIRQFVKYLYPNAVFQGKDAVIGNTSGARGRSLGISIVADESAGRWQDHATGESGDVFTLYGVAHNLNPRTDLPKIVAECDAWLGGTPTPKAEARHKVETEKAAKAGEPKQKRTKTLEMAYVYRTKEGQEWGFEQRRYRYTDDGSKTYLPYWNGNPGMPPERRPLYNLHRWHSLPSVVLVEGEKCADALASIGIEATTLMGGANTTIEKTDLTPLAGKSVILWPDHDHPRALASKPGEFVRPGYDLMARLEGPLRAMGCKVRTLRPPQDKPDAWDAADAIAEGFDVAAFLAEPAEAEAEPGPERPRLPLLDVDQLLNVPDPNWIISGWVIDDGASVWYGPPKTFKTFNVLDMAMSVACGTPWRGNEVVQQPVLYLLGEGMGTFKYRVHVWLAKRSQGRKPQFWTIPIGVPLSTPEGFENAMQAINSLPVRPGLIVVDTLNRHFGPGDENSSQDMTRFVQAIDAIRAHTRAHIAIVHHSGKDAEKGARGSSALLGAVDNEFRITRTEGTKICRIECTAARHSDEPKPMSVELIPVEVTHPETGLVMSSLLPVLRDDQDDEGRSADIVQLIVSALRAGPKTATELAEYLSMSAGHLRKFLPEMERRKLVYASTLGKAKVYHLLLKDRSSKTEETSEA